MIHPTRVTVLAVALRFILLLTAAAHAFAEAPAVTPEVAPLLDRAATFVAEYKQSCTGLAGEAAATLWTRMADSRSVHPVGHPCPCDGTDR